MLVALAVADLTGAVDAVVACTGIAEVTRLLAVVARRVVPVTRSVVVIDGFLVVVDGLPRAPLLIIDLSSFILFVLLI